MIWLKDTAGFVRKLIRFLRDSELQLLASSMAFISVLSLVPLLTVSLYVFQQLGGFEESMSQLRPLIFNYFAEGIGNEAVSKLEQLVDRLRGGSISFWGSIALFIASLKLLNDMEMAVQKIWGNSKLRPIWQRAVYYTLIITLGPILAAVLLGLLSWKKLMFTQILPDKTLVLALAWLALFLLIRYLPKCQVKSKAALIASAFTALALFVMQIFYLKITKSLFMYDKIYGSLATLPVFLIWIYVNWTLFLFGHALCASLQQYWADD
ncbi:MAG: YihY family inner membrane protein [Bdellovibrionaceae bacterium]|nr:YihY family inner membrane protein [Bdellovibrionales bacterium]MCB9085952.1 YihY family inner membrane protein [Pseudobdellovibrionaceae bacterium]